MLKSVGQLSQMLKMGHQDVKRGGSKSDAKIGWGAESDVKSGTHRH